MAISINEKSVKPTRRAAFQHVQDLSANGEISDAALGDLLLYFGTPPARQPAKTAAEWVARAVARQDVRAYLCYMWVSPEGVAYGTDGHRAHFAAVEGFAPGYYDPKTLEPADVSGKFPDVTRIMPRGPADHSVMVSDLSRQVTPDTAVYEYDGAAVSQSYLCEALNGAGGVPVEIHGTGGAIHSWGGLNEFGTFLIMGVRI